MARESFLLRTDPLVLEALRRWASDDLRSANAQLDYILRTSLRDADRLPSRNPPDDKDKNTDAGPPPESATPPSS